MEARAAKTVTALLARWAEGDRQAAGAIAAIRSEAGLPYFAMEHVEESPVTKLPAMSPEMYCLIGLTASPIVRLQPPR